MDFIWAFLIGFGTCLVFVFFLAIYKLKEQQNKLNTLQKDIFGEATAKMPPINQSDSSKQEENNQNKESENK